MRATVRIAAVDAAAILGSDELRRRLLRGLWAEVSRSDDDGALRLAYDRLAKSARLRD